MALQSRTDPGCHPVSACDALAPASTQAHRGRWKCRHDGRHDTQPTTMSPRPRFLTTPPTTPAEHHAPPVKKHWGWAQRYLVCLLAVVLSVLLPRPSWAMEDLVTQRGVLVDPHGTLTVEEVAQRTNFQPITGPISRGYTPSVTWLRIEVAPTPQGRLVLLVQPAFLDDLRLYSPSAPTTDDAQTPAAAAPIGWVEQRSGDRIALSDKAIKSVNPTFLVASRADQPTVHYLRVQTTSVSMVHVKALSLADLMAFDTFIHSVVSAYVGLIAILGGFAFVSWRITRDHLWGMDALFQLFTMLFTLTVMGLGGRYWFAEWPQAADLATSVMSVTHLGAASLFFWQLYKAYGAPGYTTWIYRATLLLLPVQLGLIALGKPQPAVSLNSNLVLLQTLTGLCFIWLVPIEDRLQRWLIRMVYIGLTLYLLYFVLPLLGLTRATEFNLYPALGSNLFSGLLMQAVLWRRTHLQLKERTALRMQLAASEQLAQHEAARRAESASLLGMLVHEIKNPLASIAIASKTLSRAFPEASPTESPTAVPNRQLERIHNAVQGIDAVLERCIEADRLEQGALLVQTEHHDVSQLVADWVGDEPEAARVRLALNGPLPAQVDAPLLCLMVRNLLNNALKYSPKGSEVSLALTAADGGDGSGRPGYRLTVANAVGKAGVPDADRLFQKYYRAPHAQHQTGTGLGLYWVHGVAHLLGGRVAYRFDAAEPLPILFELWLPLQGADASPSDSHRAL